MQMLILKQRNSRIKRKTEYEDSISTNSHFLFSITFIGKKIS